MAVEVDAVRLAIPRSYVKRVGDQHNSVLLELAYPDLRAATSVESRDRHLSNSPYIMVDVSRSSRDDYAEHMASVLESLKIPKAYMQQISRAADSKDLPGFEVYRRVRGDQSSVIYVKHIAGEQVLADCHETFPNPRCSVSFRWQKNIHVRYFFQKQWLPELERLHSGLRGLLESFVVPST